MTHIDGAPPRAPGDEDPGELAPRKEVGDAESSSEHPPHVPPHERDAPIQDELPSPDPVPTMPANAAGTDEVGTDEQAEAIDEESMYDRRPEQDKGISPSDRASKRGSD